MPALEMQRDSQQVIERVAQVLSSYPRVRIVQQRADYLHATFTSRIFRFVDDTEFYADRQTNLLHFRSASRLGYTDMGVNRKRMQQLTQRLQQEGIVCKSTG